MFCPRLPAMLPALGVALACALGAPGQAPAQPATERAVCADARSTAAMRACENDRLKRAEAGMDEAYRTLSSKLDARAQAKLGAAQEAWRRYRAAEAEYQADAARGGTLAPLIATSVQADMTEARRKELERAARELK
jgi:uncharacterized protein YecT (DUF1311 family)